MIGSVFRHQIAVAEVYQGRIFAHPRADDYPRVRGLDIVQQAGEKVEGELAGFHIGNSCYHTADMIQAVIFDLRAPGMGGSGFPSVVT